jgi:hypothetical protein
LSAVPAVVGLVVVADVMVLIAVEAMAVCSADGGDTRVR